MRATKTRQFMCVTLSLLASALLAPVSQAARIQGFESGDPAVSSTGDAGTRIVPYQGEAAPEGSNQFLLTTVGAMSLEDGVSSQSGAFAVSIASLQTFFHGVSLMGGQEGSGVLIPFTISAGDGQLTFQFDFLSNEVLQSMPRDDFAVALIFNGAGALQSGATFADVTTEVNSNAFSLFGTQTPFQFHTGYQPFSLSLAGLAPGNYSLGLGVVDSATPDHASGLLIDNVQTVAAVPEASTVSLAIAGAVLMMAVRKRLRRA